MPCYVFVVVLDATMRIVFVDNFEVSMVNTSSLSCGNTSKIEGKSFTFSICSRRNTMMHQTKAIICDLMGNKHAIQSIRLNRTEPVTEERLCRSGYVIRLIWDFVRIAKRHGKFHLTSLPENSLYCSMDGRWQRR